VPIIVPRFAIDIINNYLAMEGFPPLSEKEFIGFPVEMRLAKGEKESPSYEKYNYNASIHSFIDVLGFPGVILPMDFLQSVGERYRKDTGKSVPMEYIVVYAKVKNTDNLPAVTDRLKKMGLRVESQKDIVEKTRETMRIIDGVFFAIMAVFFIVSVISIFNSYLTIVYIRSQKFSLKRVLGFSKIRILVSFLFEALLIGAVYGAAGYFGGNYILSFAGDILSRWIPVLSSVKIQATGADMLLLCIGLSSSVCAVSAFVPAVFASNINLFKAVRR
jgi:ABC-type antimicrobial peptide transport system permease subunit